MGTGNVTLTEYSKAYGVTYAHIARQAGVTPQAISAIARGDRAPSWEVAGRIEVATHGHVPRSNWFPPGPDKPEG